MTSGELAYGAMVLLGAVLAFAIRGAESRRLGYVKHPGYRFVGLSCLLGAALGAKLGMLFYISPERSGSSLVNFFDLHVAGKTVLGALTGGYIAGELGKKIVRVDFSTGDALAIALPVALAFGRVGCFLGGCCYGTPTEVPWAVHIRGLSIHPVQLYEALACLALAGFLYRIRGRDRPAGHLFRYFLIAYALLRFSCEFVRGEAQLRLGPLSWAQVYCLAVALGFTLSVIWARRRARADHRTGSP